MSDTTAKPKMPPLPRPALVLNLSLPMTKGGKIIPQPLWMESQLIDFAQQYAQQSERDETAALRAEVERLRGQRLVLLCLLGEAAHVIHNLPDEVETQDEADMLNALKDRIADARGAVLLELAR